MNSSQMKPQSVDLTQFAQVCSSGSFESRPERLSRRSVTKLAAEFNNAVLSAFTATWIAAGIFALLGLLGAFFTRMPNNKAAARAQDGESLEKAEVPAVS